MIGSTYFYVNGEGSESGKDIFTEFTVTFLRESLPQKKSV
jgi:hypothetical protein